MMLRTAVRINLLTWLTFNKLDFIFLTGWRLELFSEEPTRKMCRIPDFLLISLVSFRNVVLQTAVTISNCRQTLMTPMICSPLLTLPFQTWQLSFSRVSFNFQNSWVIKIPRERPLWECCVCYKMVVSGRHLLPVSPTVLLLVTNIVFKSTTCSPLSSHSRPLSAIPGTATVNRQNGANSPAEWMLQLKSLKWNLDLEWRGRWGGVGGRSLVKDSIREIHIIQTHNLYDLKIYSVIRYPPLALWYRFRNNSGEKGT